MDTIDINTEKSRRAEHLARRLDRRHAGLQLHIDRRISMGKRELVRALRSA